MLGFRWLSTATTATTTAASSVFTASGLFQLGLIRAASSAVKFNPTHENFLSATSSSAIEDLYFAWKKNPADVDAAWGSFFSSVDQGVEPGLALPTGAVGVGVAPVSSAELENMLNDNRKILQLIRSYRVRGHLSARLDPLNVASRDAAHRKDLDPSTYGFTETDMDRKFYVASSLSVALGQEWMTLRDLLSLLKNMYCGSIGVESYHIADLTQRQFVAEYVEGHWLTNRHTPDMRRRFLQDLMEAEQFENFLFRKFRTAKRFGLEGGETLIPGVRRLLEVAKDLGVESVVSGMAHRGRLNFVTNVIQKPYGILLRDFAPEASQLYDVDGSGDVKYHLGTTNLVKLANGKEIHVSLVANPSHLEAVNPIVEGKTRAKQYFSHDENRSRIMSLLIHGDAAFAGQGVVSETLHLSDLPAYTTGGTVHVVINNQIGFTTDPKYARSSPYPTDNAKAIGAPILHVNGDDVEAVIRCFEFAVTYRQKFHKDVVIDIFCYRLFGHNEIDDPSMTQPHMYKRIAQHPRISDVYEKRLIAEGVIDSEFVPAFREKCNKILSDALATSRDLKFKRNDWLSSRWTGIKSWDHVCPDRPTGLPIDVLRSLGEKMCAYPADFQIHPTVKKTVDARRASFAPENGTPLDWGCGEHLAFASLVYDGVHVRLAGQDSQRGTFSHRHAVLHDQAVEGKTYSPLENITSENGDGKFRVFNSSLSEFAGLGFEVGFSLEVPNQLVMWEAQFGDFANGAQVILDQFISCGEAKWLRQSAITMLLPHGYDGQGPEHSSARIERYLQLCDDDDENIRLDDRRYQHCNMQVVYPTTPANLFHVLRRQVHRDFRKPLIVVFSKRMLRYKRAVSPLSDFAEGSRFQPVISDAWNQLVPNDQVKRVVLCSGQLYYDLLELRETEKVTDAAIVRVEELNPFPYTEIRNELLKYKNAQIIWSQEEPKNMGSWTYVSPRLESCLRGVDTRRPEFHGRPASASPATGFKLVHDREQELITKSSLGLSTVCVSNMNIYGDDPYMQLFKSV